MDGSLCSFCVYVHTAAQTAIREVDREVRREYEAIHLVHMHLDDDHDGTVDMRESAEVSSSACVLISKLIV